RRTVEKVGRIRALGVEASPPGDRETRRRERRGQQSADGSRTLQRTCRGADTNGSAVAGFSISWPEKQAILAITRVRDELRLMIQQVNHLNRMSMECARGVEASCAVLRHRASAYDVSLARVADQTRDLQAALDASAAAAAPMPDYIR